MGVVLFRADSRVSGHRLILGYEYVQPYCRRQAVSKCCLCDSSVLANRMTVYTMLRMNLRVLRPNSCTAISSLFALSVLNLTELS